MTADPRLDPDHHHLLPASQRSAAARTPAEIQAARARCSRRRVDEMAEATGNRPAVFLLELDAHRRPRAASSATGSLSLWEADLRYEVQRIASLPHTVVYVEAGYSDANSVALHRPRAQRRRRRHDPRLLHQRHPHQLDDQRGPLGQTGSRTDPRRPLHRQHGPERPRPAAHPQPASGRATRILCNPPGRGLGPRHHDHDRLRQRRRVPVDRTRRATAAAAATAARRPARSGPRGRSGWPRERRRKLGPGYPRQPLLELRRATPARRRSPAPRPAGPARPTRAPSPASRPGSASRPPTSCASRGRGQLVVGDARPRRRLAP